MLAMSSYIAGVCWELHPITLGEHSSWLPRHSWNGSHLRPHEVSTRSPMDV